MMRALYTAATGMLAQQTNVDNISNNLSNVNTVGFKQEKAEFKSLLYQTIQTESRNRFRHRWDSERELRQSHPCTHRERCRRVRMIPILQSSETDFLQCAAQMARHAIPEREILCGQWEPTALH